MKTERQKTSWQKAHKNARRSGVEARRDYLKLALRTVNEALKLSPDNENLKLRAAAINRELAEMEMPSEIQKLKDRLAEVEIRIEQAKGLSASQMVQLLAERNQLNDDILRWTRK